MNIPIPVKSPRAGLSNPRIIVAADVRRLNYPSLSPQPSTTNRSGRASSGLLLLSKSSFHVGGSQRGFSLIEVIVVVGLMSVIILGLVMMFGQTQRAYKLGTTQVDVLEGGRAVTDMLTRELLQIAPANQPVLSGATNFATTVLPPPNYYPLVQELSGSKQSRTNVLQDLFFLSRENQEWSGIGYVIRTNHPGSGVTGIPTGMGTLYRFEAKHPAAFFATYPNSFGIDFQNAILNATNLAKLIDGVVHFTVRTYDTNGWRIDPNHPSFFSSGPNLFTTTNGNISFGGTLFGEAGWSSFQSNAVPASVEIELGILEDATLAKAKAIPDPARRYDYLTNQASRVHLFRIRVPIRNVDPKAYQ